MTIFRPPQFNDEAFDLLEAHGPPGGGMGDMGM
jgi:hypothetical protein